MNDTALGVNAFYYNLTLQHQYNLQYVRTHNRAKKKTTMHEGAPILAHIVRRMISVLLGNVQTVLPLIPAPLLSVSTAYNCAVKVSPLCQQARPCARENVAAPR